MQNAAPIPVTRADQLPRRSYTLPALPSELLVGPLDALLPLADAVERDIAADLAAYDIHDAATLRELHGTRMAIAALRADRTALAQHAAQLRQWQDKPGPRLTSGLMLELCLQAAAPAPLQALVAQRCGAMPWADVQDALKKLKARLEMLTPAVLQGALRAEMDIAAGHAGLQLDGRMLSALLSARAEYDIVLPLRQAAIAGLADVIERQSADEPVKADIWTPREVQLAADSPAQPVVVGVWDSGVDLALFSAAPARGMAFTDDGRPSNDLLRPLGEAASRWPALRDRVKGALDLQAALDTEDARRLVAHVATLSPDEIKSFMEDMGLAGLYTHGTHVAGIAVAGNPFAQVYSATMLWDHRLEPRLPTEALSRRIAGCYAAIVKGLQAAGARVVNMSWRYGPQALEQALAHHGAPADADARRQLAGRLFAIERDALLQALASAPEILFVAGAGNEDNSADFEEYIPAGLELPHLITAGAVDRAGEETSFSSFGRTVVLHANGFEVEGPVPGGVRLKFSGTSMAAPQVSNLAAKLIALRPTLTPLAVKALMLETAEPRGRVRLLHPKAALARLLG